MRLFAAFRSVSAVGLLLALGLCAPAHAADGPPVDSAEAGVRWTLRLLPEAERQDLARAKYAGRYRLSELVTFGNRDGRWRADFHLPARLAGQFNDPDPLLITLEGSPHAWSVRRRKSGTLDSGLSLVTLTCYAPGVVWPFNYFSVSSDGGPGVLFTATQMFGNPAFRPSLMVSQGGRFTRVVWRIETEKYARRQVDVADVGQLAARHPDLVEHYLLPALRQLGPGRSAADVYRVFDRIPADPEVAKLVRPLVARLDGPDAADREAAHRALAAMGRPAVLATLRLDPAHLTPEQQARLSALWAAEGWSRVADVDEARKDPAFLTACTEDEDPAVRTTASTMLAARPATAR